jgi:hypothetical protein
VRVAQLRADGAHAMTHRSDPVGDAVDEVMSAARAARADMAGLTHAELVEAAAFDARGVVGDIEVQAAALSPRVRAAYAARFARASRLAVSRANIEHSSGCARVADRYEAVAIILTEFALAFALVIPPAFAANPCLEVSDA